MPSLSVTSPASSFTSKRQNMIRKLDDTSEPSDVGLCRHAGASGRYYVEPLCLARTISMTSAAGGATQQLSHLVHRCSPSNSPKLRPMSPRSRTRHPQRPRTGPWTRQRARTRNAGDRLSLTLRRNGGVCRRRRVGGRRRRVLRGRRGRVSRGITELSSRDVALRRYL